MKREKISRKGKEKERRGNEGENKEGKDCIRTVPSAATLAFYFNLAMR